MRYLARRGAWTAATLIAVSAVIFVLIRLLPGTIVDILAGPEGQLSRSQREAVLREFGLDKPAPIQYVYWIGNMVSGNFGWSFRTGRPVSQILVSRLPITIELSVLAVAGAALIGVPLGVAASISRSARIRTCAQIIGLLGLSIPNFWIGVVLIIGASYIFHWLPALIYVPPWVNPWTNLQQMALPVLSLALGLAAVVVRMTRSSMLEVLREDYIKVAWSKGLPHWLVFTRHALRNALIPIVTILGLQMGYLLGGVVITEQIFGLPGLGWTLLNGVYQRDYPVVQGAVMFFAATFILVNFIVDMIYAYVDPRIRYE